ncbi:hypothetical protein DPMN_046793 [Dreissena polymorpha]|uniref:Uncharacterized protein n=1 Tax=Dreissena polymorpha TaxID=45954 RepID=A0A9D4D6V5_DREPO|nr:hypothetical protein DPMN_046793 [Dreissena polymorpha]
MSEDLGGEVLQEVETISGYLATSQMKPQAIPEFPHHQAHFPSQQSHHPQAIEYIRHLNFWRKSRQDSELGKAQWNISLTAELLSRNICNTNSSSFTT